MRSQATGIFVIAATTAAVSLARTWWDAPGKAEQAGDLWPFASALTAVDIAIGWWCTVTERC